MTFTTMLRGAFAAVAALSLAACGINSVPTKQEAAKAQWGNVESALQNRSDKIPNLVAVVQAAAISEGDILARVTEALATAREAGANVIGLGAFASVVINFVILAFIIFLMVRYVNKVTAQFAKPEEPAAPAGPTEVELLAEIRDALKK